MDLWVLTVSTKRATVVPKVGDHVKTADGRTGVITHVQLNYPSMPGHDAVSVKWDDGGVGIGVTVAAGHYLVSRA